jgi:hypothetical protein
MAVSFNQGRGFDSQALTNKIKQLSSTRLLTAIFNGKPVAKPEVVTWWLPRREGRCVGLSTQRALPGASE